MVILEDFEGRKSIQQPSCKSEVGARRVQGGCREGARRVQGGCKEGAAKQLAIGSAPGDIKKKKEEEIYDGRWEMGKGRRQEAKKQKLI